MLFRLCNFDIFGFAKFSHLPYYLWGVVRAVRPDIRYVHVVAASVTMLDNVLR